MHDYVITTSLGYTTALVKWLACVNKMELVFCGGDGILVWWCVSSDRQFIRSVRRLKDTCVLNPTHAEVTCKRCSEPPSQFVRQSCLRCGNRMMLSYSS